MSTFLNSQKIIFTSTINNNSKTALLLTREIVVKTAAIIRPVRQLNFAKGVSNRNPPNLLRQILCYYLLKLNVHIP